MGRRGRYGLSAHVDALSDSVDPEGPTPPHGGGGAGGASASACLCFGRGSGSAPSPSATAAWYRSLKRKLGERDAEAGLLPCDAVEGEWDEEGGDAGAGLARVDIGNEAAALRETLGSHKQSVQKLLAELEEERNASASAATEAMSMILRLQHEKADAQMEARQFKRLADEKMAHDQQEIASLEDLLYKRDQAMQSLSCEVQAYRHRLLSYGIGVDGDAPPSEPQTPNAATPTCAVPQFDPFPCDYPPLRCTSDAAADLDMYPSVETPREHLQTLQQRVFQLEQVPSSSNFRNTMEKGVVVGQSPRRRPRPLSNLSYGGYGSGLEFGKGEELPAATDCASDYGGGDDMSDRVYTVDAVHGASEDYVSTPREMQSRRNVVGGGQEGEIRKLYTRLQALEADRESMRQTLISMGTDKAQMALLKEIAQQMCKEVATERRVVKKSPYSKKFSPISVIKSVVSFIFWRKRSSRVKYAFGLSSSNVGLLLLLDKSPRMRHCRFLTRTQG